MLRDVGFEDRRVKDRNAEAVYKRCHANERHRRIPYGPSLPELSRQGGVGDRKDLLRSSSSLRIPESDRSLSDSWRPPDTKCDRASRHRSAWRCSTETP